MRITFSATGTPADVRHAVLRAIDEQIPHTAGSLAVARAAGDVVDHELARLELGSAAGEYVDHELAGVPPDGEVSVTGVLEITITKPAIPGQVVPEA